MGIRYAIPSVQHLTVLDAQLVFLKKVEYYKGILVFTTNLINVIDQAFLSRVSIAIEYPSPDANVRLKIWKGFIERINPKVSTNRSRQQLLDQAEEWAESELNARQIRNIILTAESLAIGRGQTTEIKSEHIQTVLDHTIEFQEKVGRGRSDRSIYSHSH
jgi:AAA+ superfamily predicted ATPase